MQNPRLTGMPAFFVIWIGQIISLFGTALFSFAIGIWLYQQTGLATTFTNMIFFSNLPRIVLSPFAGVLVDRWNRKITMVVSDLATGITTLTILVLILNGSLNIWLLYLLVGLSSAFESFQFPAFSSSITLLVDKSHYSRTNAMLSLAEDGARVIAPLMAAALITRIDLEGIVLIDVISCVVAIATLLFVSIPRSMPSDAGTKTKGNLLSEAGYGFRYIFANSGLLWLQFNFTMVNLLAMSNALRTPMILARTGNDEVILGIVASVAAVGGLAGGLVMSVWGGPKRRIHGVLWGLIMIYIGRASMGLGREVFVWSISGFIAVFFVALCNSSNQALWQTKTPVDVQGRVFAARRVTGQLSIPIASLMAGPLSDRLFEPAMTATGGLAPIFGWLVGTGPGAGMSLLIFAAAAVGIIIPWLSYTFPAFRHVEEAIPDADVASELEQTNKQQTSPDRIQREPKPTIK